VGAHTVSAREKDPWHILSLTGVSTAHDDYIIRNTPTTPRAQALRLWQ